MKIEFKEQTPAGKSEVHHKSRSKDYKDRQCFVTEEGTMKLYKFTFSLSITRFKKKRNYEDF